MAGETSMPALDSDIRLTLPARPENVAVVRHVLGALAHALRLPEVVRDDVRLAVTEACTNVVRHAYPDDEGTMDVVAQHRGDALEVTVSDRGRGIAPHGDSSGLGLGLPLIAALADTVRIERRRDAGSRLVMSFLRCRAAPAMELA
jgi:serine/threonine-protein kinase RsbW